MSIVHSDGACSDSPDGKGEQFCLAVSISEGQMFNRYTYTHENNNKILLAYVARAIYSAEFGDTPISSHINISVHTVVLYSTLVLYYIVRDIE